MSEDPRCMLRAATGVHRRDLVRATCACIEVVLVHEDRATLQAFEGARRWAQGSAPAFFPSEDELARMLEAAGSATSDAAMYATSAVLLALQSISHPASAAHSADEALSAMVPRGESPRSLLLTMAERVREELPPPSFDALSGALAAWMHDIDERPVPM